MCQSAVMLELKKLNSINDAVHGIQDPIIIGQTRLVIKIDDP